MSIKRSIFLSEGTELCQFGLMVPAAAAHNRLCLGSGLQISEVHRGTVHWSSAVQYSTVKCRLQYSTVQCLICLLQCSVWYVYYSTVQCLICLLQYSAVFDMSATVQFLTCLRCLQRPLPGHWLRRTCRIQANCYSSIVISKILNHDFLMKI